MGTNQINTYVLSIAGFDPSAGAGSLADIKTFESHKVYGLGVVSALTFQNDSQFDDVSWISAHDIIKQIQVLKRRFDFRVIKIGLIKDFNTLYTVVDYLVQSNENSLIIWDPIIKATAGYEFHNTIDVNTLNLLLSKIYLITPNSYEAVFLTKELNPYDAAKALSASCNVLLKGGHNKENVGTDYLFTIHQSEPEIIAPNPLKGSQIFPKHGSGCILSSSIAAHLAKGYSLTEACIKAKIYTEKFLSSSHQLISFHYA
jgi:hydroxymethylpyrimidine/phosphomethylpyrimidine kinase